MSGNPARTRRLGQVLSVSSLFYVRFCNGHFHKTPNVLWLILFVPLQVASCCATADVSRLTSWPTESTRSRRRTSVMSATSTCTTGAQPSPPLDLSNSCPTTREYVQRCTGYVSSELIDWLCFKLRRNIILWISCITDYVRKIENPISSWPLSINYCL